MDHSEGSITLKLSPPDFFVKSNIKSHLLSTEEILRWVGNVLTWIEAGCDSVLVEEWISEIIWSERQIVRALNNWLIIGVKEDLGIVQISAPKLRAGHTDSAVAAITEENWTFDWSDVKSGIFTFVDHNLETE